MRCCCYAATERATGYTGERLCTVSALARALRGRVGHHHLRPQHALLRCLAALEIIKAATSTYHSSSSQATSTNHGGFRKCAGAHDYLNKNNPSACCRRWRAGTAGPATGANGAQAHLHHALQESRRGCVPWPPARPASFFRCAVVRHADCLPLPAKPARCYSGLSPDELMAETEAAARADRETICRCGRSLHARGAKLNWKAASSPRSTTSKWINLRPRCVPGTMASRSGKASCGTSPTKRVERNTGLAATARRAVHTSSTSGKKSAGRIAGDAC